MQKTLETSNSKHAIAKGPICAPKVITFIVILIHIYETTCKGKGEDNFPIYALSKGDYFTVM